MNNLIQRLTDGLIIFSVVVSDFEKLDFKNDALAGVRANYFNSNFLTQHDKTEVMFDDVPFKLSYELSKNQPLAWKITKKKHPYQSVKKETGGVYCVMYYAENGTIYKRQYFNAQHEWLRSEYFDAQFKNLMLCRISPEIIRETVTLRYEKRQDDGTYQIKTLFPSQNTPKTRSDALIYSNVGMLWYDDSFCPDNFFESDDEKNQKSRERHFDLKPENFEDNNISKKALDLSKAEYLEYSDEELNSDVEDNKISDMQTTEYSAYDKIQKILTEAQKTNKDLFGEIINNTKDDVIFDGNVNTDDSVAENITENTKIISNVETDEIISTDEQLELTNEVDSIDNAISEEVTVAENEILDENIDDEISDVQKTDENNEIQENIDDSDYELKDESPCDVIIRTQAGRYAYYGELDSDNCRVGRGRTVSPLGYTAYDGEYKNDLRNGFGVCYYKGGEINYVGQWSDNNRNGCGVGYRLSDGTMHAGKWNDNKPDGYGARFDSDGNLVDVCKYNNGVRSGKSFSFDENGNVVITKWENGVKISEQTIEIGD